MSQSFTQEKSIPSRPPSPPRVPVSERSSAQFPLESSLHSSTAIGNSTQSPVVPLPPVNITRIASSSTYGKEEAVESTQVGSARGGGGSGGWPAPLQSSNPNAMAEGIAISLRTITEQQRVIKSLQDLVQATKSRVAYLEDINRALVKEKGGQQEPPPLLLEELSELRTNNVKLLQRTSLMMEEKGLLEQQLASTREALNDLGGRFRRQQQLVQELQSQEERWKQQTALLRLSETDRRKLQIENVELRESLDRSAFEKKRWRALVQTLSCRLHPSLNSHIEKHIQTMVMEEERRYQAAVQQRKQRQAALLAEMEAAAAQCRSAGLAADGSEDPLLSSRGEASSNAISSKWSESNTGGEGRSVQNAPLQRTHDDSGSQPYSSDSTEHLMAIWRKDKDDVGSGSTPYSFSPLASDGSPGSNALESNSASTPEGSPQKTLAHQGAQGSKGTLPNIPFHQGEGVPARAPGSPALGLFEEDPRYDFGPGTLPIQMLMATRGDSVIGSRGRSSGGGGGGSNGVGTKSISDILRPEERKRKKQEEGRKGRHLVPL